ncbi:MAG TPA: tagatose 1,6-diphosphate aldolase [Candidatus Binatia bacterium]|nr:tagatose 1,6-diphosphate aldolase [Candidatus Binatia bacterium]
MTSLPSITSRTGGEPGVAGLPLGRVRGLQACSSASGCFVILAMDHRRNLRRELRPERPEAVTDEELVAFKQSVVRHLAPLSTAVLLDPQYGLAQCLVSRAVPGATGLVVALEATGYLGESSARRNILLEGWSVEAARRSGADAVKLLVYYHPSARTAPDQEALVVSTVEACRRAEVPLFLEPLVYSPDPDRPLSADARRDAVFETARRLSALGPDVLKIELPVSPDADDLAMEAACRELDAASAVPWTILSGGMAFDQFQRATEIACRAGASGVVVGRAVWGEAARSPADERSAFLAETGRSRLSTLRTIVDRVARPWWVRHPLGQLPEPSPDWYRSSGGSGSSG